MNLVFAASFKEAAIVTMALPLIGYITMFFWFSRNLRKVSGPVTMPTRKPMVAAVADADAGQASQTSEAEPPAQVESGSEPATGPASGAAADDLPDAGEPQTPAQPADEQTQVSEQDGEQPSG